MHHPLLIFSQLDYLIQIFYIASHTKWQTVQIQISWLRCFFRSQLIWIYTVCKGRIYPGSAGQGLKKYSQMRNAIHFFWRLVKVSRILLFIFVRHMDCQSRTKSQKKQMLRNVRKRIFRHLRSAKIQLSLLIRTVWSEFSLGTFLIPSDTKYLHEDKDPEQAAQMRRLIWVFLRRASERTFSHIAAQPVSAWRKILQRNC